MATATPNPTPNPNALKFQLDATLDGPFNFTTAEQAAGHPFAEAVFAVGGVVSVFGTNDFVSVNRADGVDWDPIVAAVQEAAATHL